MPLADLTDDEVNAAAMVFGAGMWEQWAAINDRIAAELPVRYEISYSMRRFDFAVLLWRGDEMVSYPDPPDLDRNGSVFQILEAALEAAKAHDIAHSSENEPNRPTPARNKPPVFNDGKP